MNVRRLIVVAAAVAQHRSSYRFELSLKGAELPQRPLWVISEQALRSPNPTVNSGLDRSLGDSLGYVASFVGVNLFTSNSQPLGFSPNLVAKSS
jgi:hypothetical protein